MDANEPKTVGIPDGPQSLTSDQEQEYRKEFERRFEYSQTCFSDWRAEAKRYYDTYAGDPWPDVVKDQLDDEGRPRTNFNYALSTANAVLGQDMADEKEARFRAALEFGDFAGEFTAENLTRVVRHVYRMCGIPDQEYMAELDQLVTGYGFCEGFVNTNRFPHRIEGKYVDCFEVYIDPNYQQDNCEDGLYIIHEKRWSLEAAKVRWPGFADDLETLTRKQGNAKRPILPVRVPDATQARRGTQIDWNTDDRYVWVYDYQRKRYEKFVGFRDPMTGALREVPAKEFKKIEAQIFAARSAETGLPTEASLQSVSYDKLIVDRGWLAGVSGKDVLILEPPQRVMEDMFTIRAVTGFRRKEQTAGKTMHFGLIAVAYEPQLLAAKALSSGIEYIARGTKGGFLVDPSAIENPAQFIVESVKPGYRGLTAPGALAEGKKVIEKLPEPVWNPGYEAIFNTAVNQIPYTTQATDALKGTLRQERSNVLITNLQEKSLISLNPLARPMVRFRKEMAQLIVLLVKNYMPADQFNKLLTGQKLEGVTYQLVPDPMTGEEVEQPITIPHLTPDGKPVIDPKTGGPLERPVTPHDLMLQVNPLDFLVTVDVGSASSSAKENFFRLFTSQPVLTDLLKDQDVREVLMPKMLENIPDFPAEDAKKMARELKERFELRQMQGTFEGVVTALSEMPPDQLMQVRQVLDEMEQAAAGAAAPQPNAM